MNECEMCAYYVYDEDFEEYECMVNMDEDDMVRMLYDKSEQCPYFQSGDEYKIALKQ